MHKVFLTLVDGMRPDAMIACGHPFVEKLMRLGCSTLRGRTVIPPVTLPCHMSLIHSVDPDRHGVTTNLYTPPVRPVTGLFEQLSKYDKTSAFFYGWGQLKDLYRPSSLADACFVSGRVHGWYACCEELTDRAIENLRRSAPDFTFLYLPEVDEMGHKYGWMREEYLQSVYHAFACIERVYRALPEDEVLMVTADHGGHGRDHGQDIPEDMTIPFIACGAPFPAGEAFEAMNLKDIAPTIARVMEIPADADWEGKAL